MKVFTPVSDQMLNDRGELTGRLVPFDPRFMVHKTEDVKEEKPTNWISNTDYKAACQRLRQSVILMSAKAI